MNFLDRYELVLTEDQSPTFRDLISPTQETMHHRGGAYSETQMIYGNPLRLCLDHGGNRILSVGLGLGYNEILVASECLKRDLTPKDVFLLSFESEAPLREAFIQWIQDGDNQIYDQIGCFFEVDILKVKSWLQEALSEGSWKLEGALTEEIFVNTGQGFHCVFYDAFSSKTSPELWTEVFLKAFAEKICSSRCVLSTYACTGALKRALQQGGFELLLKPGFHGKRLRTMGIKGWSEQARLLFLDL